MEKYGFYHMLPSSNKKVTQGKPMTQIVFMVLQTDQRRQSECLQCMFHIHVCFNMSVRQIDACTVQGLAVTLFDTCM